MIKIKNDYVDAYLHLGDIYLSTRDTQKTIDFYLEALHVNPYLENVYINLGVLYINQNKIEEALSIYLEGLLLYRESELLYNNLSNIIRGNVVPKKF